MKQTKLKSNNKDITIIGEEWTGEDHHPTLSCNFCNRDLVRLADRNNQGES